MSVWTQWTHAPLPDAACVSVELTGSDNRLSFGAKGPPTRCRFSDSTACGQNGRCVSLKSLYDQTWSRDADNDDNVCWFLAYLEGRDVVTDPSATYGICQCFANFDGDNCEVCRAGWAGTKCDEPYTAIRRPLAAYSSSEMPDIQAAFGEIDAGIDDLIPEGGLVDWMHSTVVMDYPDECTGWPHNPHKGSIWLMQWHRPLLRFTEASLVARGLEGLPYWNTTAPDAAGAAYALHPELRELRPGCPAISVWGVAQALGVGSSNILAECKGYVDPDDEERCLKAYGITIASIFDEDELLSYDYAPFLEGVKHMHVYVHCWFVAAGYVSRGCNAGTAAEMIRGATSISEAEAEACAAMPTKYVGVGDDSPLFFIFHTYLDALLEKRMAMWMQRHGYDAACDEGLRTATTDLQWIEHKGEGGNTRDAHPDSCIAQSLLASATYSIRDSCVAAETAWGYRYDETLPSSASDSAWAQTATWVRASFAWKEFMLGFFISATAALVGLRYWLHRRRQMLEAGVLELREMRLAGAIAKGVQYPAYP